MNARLRVLLYRALMRHWPAMGFGAIFVLARLFIWAILSDPLLGRQEHDARKEVFAWWTFAAFAYGAYRVFSDHPIWKISYRDWLRATPWRECQPLPFHDVRLGWPDAAVFACLALVAAGLYDIYHALITVEVGLAGYLIALGITCRVAGLVSPLYMVLFGLGAVIFLHDHPWFGFVVCCGLYPPLLARIPQTLSGIVSGEDVSGLSFRKALFGDVPHAEVKLGWPFVELSPYRPTAIFGRNERLALCALVGWWVYVLSGFDEKEAMPVLIMVMIMSTIFATFTRLGMYCARYWSPTSLWARIRKGPLLVRGYDYVFLTPLLTLVVGLGAPVILIMVWDIPIRVTAPCVVTLVLAMSMLMKPSFESWRLTGGHRIRPAPGKTKLVQL